VQFVSGHDERIYHWTLATLPALMLNGRDAKALIMGGGDGLAARNLLALPNIKKIRMVELDPVVVDLSANHPVMRQLNQDAFRNPRLEVTIGDAKKWLRMRPRERYDLAILDFPDPLTPELTDLFSGELYQTLCRDHMVPKGEVIAVQSSSAFSDVEDMVAKNLFWATGTFPARLRFAGQWMEDGVIVAGGSGVDPRRAKVPPKYQAKDPAHHVREEHSLNVF
jgi:spermidine synthase